MIARRSGCGRTRTAACTAVCIDRSLDIVRQLAYLVQAAGACLMWGLAALLPPAWASRTGAALFGFLGPKVRKQRQVVGNLRVACAGADEAEIQSLARGVWRNFGAVLFEYPHLGRIYRDGLEVKIAPETQALLDAGTPIVVAAAHLANWELLGCYLGHTTRNMNGVYGPQRNPYLDALLQRFRRASRCRYVPKQDALREFTRKSLAGGSVGLLLDVRVDTGVSLPLFDVATPTTISPARMALRLDYPLVPARAKRLGPARFELELLAPLHAREAGAGKAAAIDLTLQYNALLESWIRERPDEWLCTKRRWPKSAMLPAQGA
ncbi:MAG: lysophospholipid acyltransferase family protein [Pseudomonadales bacterium]